ncbi:hypothetical protein ACWIUD_02790 [Helicobacter sp. 23-1044]
MRDSADAKSWQFTPTPSLRENVTLLKSHFRGNLLFLNCGLPRSRPSATSRNDEPNSQNLALNFFLTFICYTSPINSTKKRTARWKTFKMRLKMDL